MHLLQELQKSTQLGNHSLLYRKDNFSAFVVNSYALDFIYDEQENITRMTVPELKLAESSTVVAVVLSSQSLEVKFLSQAENINYQ